MNKTFENCTLLDTKTWFEKAVPTPTLQNFNAQLGVHCEEVAEMLEQIEGFTPEVEVLVRRAHEVMGALGEYLKTNSKDTLVTVKNQVLFLDAMCDQIVTSTGTCHMASMDVVGAMTEVNRSNFSKFSPSGEPIFHPESKKIMKGPNYSPAELSPYVPQ